MRTDNGTEDRFQRLADEVYQVYRLEAIVEAVYQNNTLRPGKEIRSVDEIVTAAMLQNLHLPASLEWLTYEGVVEMLTNAGDLVPRKRPAETMEDAEGGEGSSEVRRTRRQVTRSVEQREVVQVGDSAPQPQEQQVLARRTAQEAAPVQAGAPRQQEEEEEEEEVVVEEEEEDSSPQPQEEQAVEQEVAPVEGSAPQQQEGQASGQAAPRNKRDGEAAKKRNSPGEKFGANIKKVLDERNKRATDVVDKDRLASYGVFPDAIVPRVDAGDNLQSPAEIIKAWQAGRPVECAVVPLSRLVGGDVAAPLHPMEKELVRCLKWTDDQYRTQKARVFLGMALVVAYNEYRTETDDKAKVQNFTKTFVQQSCSKDVNMSSRLAEVFKAWGWWDMHAMKTHIPSDYFERFPRRHRYKLLQEMVAFEKECVRSENPDFVPSPAAEFDGALLL